MPLFQGVAGRSYSGGGGGISPIGGGGDVPTAAPTRGQGAFGMVPGAIAVPQSQWAQLSGVLPNFNNLTTGTTGIIGSQLRGEVSDATMDALKRGAAEWGVASGMPGSGLERNKLFANLAGFSEGLQQKGLQNYLATIGQVGALQTNPALAASIAERNALYAAAPDPEAAYRQAEADRLKWYNRTRNDSMGYRPTGTGGRGGTQWAGVSGMPSLGVPGPPASFNRATGDFGPNQVAYGPGGGPNINASDYPVGTKFDFVNGQLVPNRPTGALPNGMLIYERGNVGQNPVPIPNVGSFAPQSFIGNPSGYGMVGGRYDPALYEAGLNLGFGSYEDYYGTGGG